MRAALCIFAILFAFTGVSSGQDDKSKRQKEKPIQLPSFDFNGYRRAVRKTSVPTPQMATPASRIDHSDGLSAHSLPSFTTYVSIALTLCILASTPRARRSSLEVRTRRTATL